MQGAELVLRIVAAAGRLAVEGDDRPLDARLGRGLVAEAGDPGVEGGLEGRGLERHQDAAEDVLAGDAVGQVEDAGEELLLELGPAGDGGGPGGAGEDGQDGDDQDAGQGMLPIDVGAGILEGGEGSHDLVQLGAFARHRRPPTTGCGSRHGGRYTRSGGRAQARRIRPIVIKVPGPAPDPPSEKDTDVSGRGQEMATGRPRSLTGGRIMQEFEPLMKQGKFPRGRGGAGSGDRAVAWQDHTEASAGRAAPTTRRRPSSPPSPGRTSKSPSNHAKFRSPGGRGSASPPTSCPFLADHPFVRYHL